jgi:predicted HTH domain antitoxin
VSAGACPCACPHLRAGGLHPDGDERRELSGTALLEHVCHLYECEELSTYRIGAVLAIDRQRVGRMLRRAGVVVKARGAGRSRAQDARAELAEDLYLRRGLSTTEISELLEVPGRTVRDWLRAREVPMRTRGPMNREDRQDVPTEALAELYVRCGLSAADTGRLLGAAPRVVLRAAHDAGLPVRLGGPPPEHGPAEIELIDAIYADPLVCSVLARHAISAVSAGGAIWRRFPSAVPVSADLVTELYLDCGLALRHIELLSGQPQQTLLKLLHRLGVPVRDAGGRSPFLRRWRTLQNAGLGQERDE